MASDAVAGCLAESGNREPDSEFTSERVLHGLTFSAAFWRIAFPRCESHRLTRGAADAESTLSMKDARPPSVCISVSLGGPRSLGVKEK